MGEKEKTISGVVINLGETSDFVMSIRHWLGMSGSTFRDIAIELRKEGKSSAAHIIEQFLAEQTHSYADRLNAVQNRLDKLVSCIGPVLNISDDEVKFGSNGDICFYKRLRKNKKKSA